ncbi:hypothetical protein GDO86_011392 [Hymenochirus boettgeri]|uniref:Little elongation complex subunit 1 C-terminal domain-containing protein n=1 Tax=Hymenochirus boettgeri TaxID=247094 RepID=A0A8T2JG76_9PIPI|nr:hypothetical protein GDO86_011392 [Hymenochirus boettgeri]
MMPGENHTKTVGIASEADGACQNCTALQQSLNEYVATLLGLKQKIIDSDHLLAEYQQKCDELLCTERENETLRYQLDQILQKMSRQENQDDLKSLRAELEEKTSSLKIYQQTKFEYNRVKEECARTENIKKKLEEKFKKMEGSAAKRLQDLKKLKKERNALVKQLKRTQNKLKCFQNEKKKKGVKHVQTQISIKEPVMNIDKEKMKLLLEELWGCIDSSTDRRPYDQLMENNGKKPRKQRSTVENKIPCSHSSPLMLKQSSKEPPVFNLLNKQKKSKDPKILEDTLADFNGDSAFYEEKTSDFIVPRGLIGSHSPSPDHDKMTDEFLEILDWARPLPPLLSPIKFSPLTTQDDLFGECTASSEEEIECNTEKFMPNSTMRSSESDKRQASNKVRTDAPDIFGKVVESSRVLDTSVSIVPMQNNKDKENNNASNNFFISPEVTQYCLDTEKERNDCLSSFPATDVAPSVRIKESVKHLEDANNFSISCLDFMKTPQSTERTNTNLNGCNLDGPVGNIGQTTQPEIADIEMSIESSHNNHSILHCEDETEELTKYTTLENVTKPLKKSENGSCAPEDSLHCKTEENVTFYTKDPFQDTVPNTSSTCHVKNTVEPLTLNHDCSSQSVPKQKNVLVKQNKLISKTNTISYNQTNGQDTMKTEVIKSDGLSDCGNKIEINDVFVTLEQPIDINILYKGGMESCHSEKTTKSTGNEAFNIETNSVLFEPPFCDENTDTSGSNDFCVSEGETVHYSMVLKSTETKNIVSESKCILNIELEMSTPHSSGICQGTTVKHDVEKSTFQENYAPRNPKDQAVFPCCVTSTLEKTQKQTVQEIKISKECDEHILPKSPCNDVKASMYTNFSNNIQALYIQNLCEQENDHKQKDHEIEIEASDQENIAKTEEASESDNSLSKMIQEYDMPSNHNSEKENHRAIILDEYSEVADNLFHLKAPGKKDGILMENCPVNNNSEKFSILMCESKNTVQYNSTVKLHSLEHRKQFDHLLLNQDPADSSNHSLKAKIEQNIAEHTFPPNTNNTANEPFKESKIHNEKNEIDMSCTESHNEAPAESSTTNGSYNQLVSITSKLSLEDSTPVPPPHNDKTLTKTFQVIPVQKCIHFNSEISEPKDILEIRGKYRNIKEDMDLDSDDSEEEFLVRKVNYVKSLNLLSNAKTNVRNNTINTNNRGTDLFATSKIDLDEIAEANCLEKDKFKTHTSKLYDNNSDSIISAECSIIPNELLSTQIESDSISSEMDNNTLLKTKSTNSVPLVTVEKIDDSEDVKTYGRGISDTEKDLNKQVAATGSNFPSKINNAEEQSANNHDTLPNKKITPGKNLIWNFERPDDIPVPRGKKNKINFQRTSGRELLDNCIFSNKYSLNGLEGPSNSKNIVPVAEVGRENNILPRALSQDSHFKQTVLANADTSSNVQHSPETISKVRSEMGPPLPPLLGPLMETPPRTLRPLSPVMSSSSRSSLPSPLDELISPLRVTPVLPVMSPISDSHRYQSHKFATPSPSERANRRILSSPLQFCSATPKHALPVPGRLPPSAAVNPAPTVQENSVKILDTMYPELSARARTLNILKGNVQLNRCLPGDCKPVSVSQITGFKVITSTSTAFIKTGSKLASNNNKDNKRVYETEQTSSNSISLNKRSSECATMPKSAKRLRLESPCTESFKHCFTVPTSKSPDETQESVSNSTDFVSDLSTGHLSTTTSEEVTKALKKVEELCFDLLPVIKSHVFVGTIPKIPVMRNEEKEVIYEFSTTKKDLADQLLHAIIRKLKTDKNSLDGNIIQGLCRVYTGLCRQLGDLERARILCYSILIEDFPDPDKLLLFIISSWKDILTLNSVISKAIHGLLKHMASEEVIVCLSAYLNWEKSPPQDVSIMLSSVLMAIQLCPDQKFQQRDEFGEDLTDSIWEYVFVVNLLCSHHKWIWTHDNVISKELWPILDKWVKRKKGNVNVSFIADIIIAAVLRLLGFLSRMGLREGFVNAVRNICSVIITFIQHAKEEDVPWGVQLASVYMLCDLAPCDPENIHKTLETWRTSTVSNIPPAVSRGLEEVASLCAKENLIHFNRVPGNLNSSIS